MQKCSIQSQVHLANDTIKQLKVRISVMENRLKNDELPEPKRREVENELVEIKKLLDKNEEILKGLHKENSKSFVLARKYFLWSMRLIYRRDGGPPRLPPRPL
uniref:CSON006704 protein n=1 Tax=Culicoides sonorensis TaxID=179676 RepID=A0A336L8P4_CULSO